VAGRELRVAVNLGAALAGVCDTDDDEQPCQGAEQGCPDTHPSSPTARSEDLLRRAQAALVVAAERGSDYAIWTRALERDVERRLALDAEMRGALTAGQFTVYYQPVYHPERLEDGSTRWMPVGAEALVRWAHPTMGLLLPGSFLQLASETGLLEELDAWVLRTATWDAARHFPPSARVSVNVSSLQLTRPDFPQEVADALTVSALEPERLVVEVVESDLRGDQTCVDNIRALRRLGVHVAIDDFGVGHSHLARLATLEVDILKVDRSFVIEGRRLLETAVKIGQDLGLEVVVEGAERSDDLARFAEQGVRVQSFAFARPMPLEAIRSVLVGKAEPKTV
jgi:EAL domain-containing protein (putative c-di-GMP-specific phosphodiesterase class I)